MKAKRYREDEVEECGCCGCHHLLTFSGDCRDDNNRLVEADEDKDGFPLYVAASDYDKPKSK